jgi:D-beta-D-heptose 7-phosphate kinase/D-beta-D-heptose 1-phosphate adenosyltransferase
MISYRDVIARFDSLYIMVVGDPMFDVYHWGHVNRMSPEAPVPVFIEDKEEIRQGGAANVLHQLKALGVTATAHFPRQPWTEKHRYLVGGHQLLRIDKDIKKTTSTNPSLVGLDAVILSDYAKGALTADLCASVMKQARELEIPVIVDPKGEGWAKYRDCTIICPNEQEAKNKEIEVFETVLFKQGANGMTLLENGHKTHIPAAAQAVFDVTGAGDTVVAVLAACMAAGATLKDAAYLANLAAGHVVSLPGTATCTADDLYNAVYIK